jgi:hypothetical protein
MEVPALPAERETNDIETVFETVAFVPSAIL